MQTEDSKIGFIGLGLMGKPMSLNLKHSGYDLIVHNRSAGAAEGMAALGMTAAATPAGLAGEAHVIIIMVTDTDAVQDVLFGRHGVVSGLQQGTLVMDMGTTDATATKDFAATIEAGGGMFVDAPVSGGEIGAKEGNLTIMVGAQQAGFQRALPLLKVLGQRITHVGDVGSGQVTKAANQVIVGLTIGAVAEALNLARRCGVEPEKLREALRGGFAWSRILELHGERMINNNFEPGARLGTQRKDLAQALSLAATVDARMPSTSLTLELYDEAVRRGFSELDHSALIKILE